MKKTLALLSFASVLALAACQPKPSSSSQDQAAPAAAPQAASPAPAAPAAAPASAALTSPEKLVEKAPDTYKARFKTTKGDFVVEVHRDWAPNGADRFYNLVKNGFYNDTAFFRVVPGFMVQFGITGSPDLNTRWRMATIPDDPNKQSNKPGIVTFATAGPNTRTTQVFINFNDNAFLDGQGFSPFGKIVEGMDVVNSLYSGYGEGAPSGRGPDQGRLQGEGNSYLKSAFPQMDYTLKTTVE
jgi:peptidyl-prolyl cis-trans isomerase A (cyclophilin A)